MITTALKSSPRGLSLAIALFVAMISSTAQAYTPEQQQLCTGDAFRLCGSEIPDVDRVTVCMIAKKAELSPGCRSVFRQEQESVEVAPQPKARAARKTAKVSHKPPRKSPKSAAKSDQ